MNLDELRVAATAQRDKAQSELDDIRAQLAELDSVQNFHRSAVRDAVNAAESARLQLPGLLASVWIARMKADSKAEKLLQADVAKLRAVIAYACECEQERQTVLQGVDTLRKGLNNRAHSPVGSSPNDRLNIASNILNRLPLVESEGLHRHGDVLRFNAEKLGLPFGYEQPRSPVESLAA